MTQSSHVYKGPCIQCGSRDNVGVYDDGHGYCYGCGAYYPNYESSMECGNNTDSPGVLGAGNNTATGVHRGGVFEDHLVGDPRRLSKRGIDQDTCEKWSYWQGYDHGEAVQIANYRDSFGRIVAQKVRYKPDSNGKKRFKFLGNPKQVDLYGQHLWRAGGKMVTITEGEIDALSVSQMFSNKWPVVSVPNGAQNAEKSVSKALDWLVTFDRVVLLFDNDEPGMRAAERCAQILPPGKAYIAHLPLKDANEMLVAGRNAECIDAIWSATPWRPDGILDADAVWQRVTAQLPSAHASYPWAGLNDKLGGLRRGELVTICAGTGVGKSAFCREMAHHLITSGETVGYIALEESVRRTALGLVGIDLDRPLHQTMADWSQETDSTKADVDAAYRRLFGSNRLFLYDHFGSLDIDNLLSRIRYMASGLQCGWIVLDHISIVVSGIQDAGEGERRLIDIAMTKLRSLVEETGVGLILVSHLKRPEGKAHEEGARTTLAQLRGSAAIAQLSDAVIGLERDQQAEDEDRDETTVRVLKNRFSGDTGVACYLIYSHETGRLGLEDPQEFE